MQVSKGNILMIVSVAVAVVTLAGVGFYFMGSQKPARTSYNPSDLGGEFNVTTETYPAYGTYVNAIQKYSLNYPATTSVREVQDFNRYCTMLSYKNGYIIVASLKDDQMALDSGRAISSCATINGLGSGYVPTKETVLIGYDEFQAVGYEYKETMYPEEQNDRALFFPFNNNLVVRYGFANKSDKPVSEEEFKETMTTIKIMLLTLKSTK